MSHPVYGHRVWARLSRQVIERDHHICQIRLPGCRGRATTADHIIELEDGGAKFDPRNLQAACVSCNTSKRNRRVAEKARSQVRAW